MNRGKDFIKISPHLKSVLTVFGTKEWLIMDATP